MRTNLLHRNIKMPNPQHLNQKQSLPTLPLLPARPDEITHIEASRNMEPQPRIYESTNEEKVIPGYNFQSLFRKKSHIRLARKKNKEDAQKKNSNLKLDNCSKEAKNTQKGHWTQEQNRLYHWFLEIHNRHFILKYLRRTDKIFKSMANFIRTREAEQCRSHHQKMQKKYHNFYQILLKLRMQFYNCASPDLLKIELDENGYKIREYALISEQELKNGDLLKSDKHNEEIKSENSIKHSIDDDIDSSNQENSLLGENYEKELDLKLKYQ